MMKNSSEHIDNVTNPEMVKRVLGFAKRGFTPCFGEPKKKYPSHPLWKKINTLGTELWYDSGSIGDISTLWTQEFSALTTNNSLLNKEIQKGIYDSLIVEAREMLLPFNLSQEELLLEIHFIMNAWHALRLVEKFDAFVCIEEHTALAHNRELAIEHAHRYYGVCPERFIVKIPFTPSGILATRNLAQAGVPVNHTLGFSARQNYLAACIAQPLYVNVFMGRLNSFVKQNGLGDGEYIGEKATIASQKAVMELRQELGIPTRQIGASFRSAEQVRALVGIDVMTLPPHVAEDFLGQGLRPADIKQQLEQDYQPRINNKFDNEELGMNVLWDVTAHFKEAVRNLENEDVDSFTAAELITYFEDQKLADLFPRWTRKQILLSTEEGKIPNLSNWSDEIVQGYCSLDSLMNLAGLNSFVTDQAAMDRRVLNVLENANFSSKRNL